MSQRDAYERKLAAQLDELNAEIDRLKARAAKAEADSEIDYQRQIDDLKAHREQARQKFHELRDASEDAWEEVRQGAERAWQDLSDAVRSASKKFR